MRILIASLLVFVTTLLAGCGGGDDGGGGSGGGKPTIIAISITPASGSVAAGLTRQLSVRATYSDTTIETLSTGVTWDSSEPATATIDANGLVTGVVVGSTVITASVEGLTAHSVFTVTHNESSPLLSIDVTPAPAEITLTQTQQFVATGHYADGAAVDITASASWGSSNTAAATIDAAGLATAVALGSTTITATVGLVAANTTLTVTPPVLVSLTVTPRTSGVLVGNTQQFAAYGNYSDGSTVLIPSGVTWASSSTGVATIDSNGLATGVAVGSTKIIASWNTKSTNVNFAVGLGIQHAGDFVTGEGPVDLLATDYNEDGHLDLVVANFLGSTYALMAGDGTGQLQAATNVATSTALYRLASGHFTADSHLDVVGVSYSAAKVILYAGTGTAFGGGAETAVGQGPDGISTADFNGDGFTDIVVANNTDDSITVLFGNGAGVLGSPLVRAVGDAPGAITATDFNGDGKADILVANYNAGTLSYLAGNGDGSFAAVTTFTVGTKPGSMAIGDVNGDGELDALVAVADGVRIMAGDGNGSFTAGALVNPGPNPSQVALADLDADGALDMMVTNYLGGTLSILMGSGTGTFSARQIFTIGENPYMPVVADFNEDGRPDIAVIASVGNTVSILLNL